MDGHRTGGTGRAPVVVHGVAAEVQARGLLLHEHPLGGGILRQVGQVDGRGLGIASAARAEHVQLALHIHFAAVGDGIQHLLVHLDQLGTVGPHGIEGARADQVLHRTLVHIAAVEHPLAEVLEGGEGAALVPLAHQCLNETPADVLDGHKAEADAALLHGEAVVGAVHVRRQQGDAALPALGDILRHLVGVVQHRGQQRRHIFAGIVTLEVRRLIGHHRVADGVGLVEGVVGKVIDLVIDGLGRFLWNAVGHAALDVTGGVAVEERLPLPFHVLGLLLGHGAAHHVRLTQRVARQLLEYLDDLLLIDDTAVGARQDGLQRRMLIGHQLGIVLAGDEPGDGFHGAGAVQGYDGGDILDGLGLQTQADAGHAGGFHLEHAGGAALRQHPEHLRIVHGDLLQIEVRGVAVYHLHRVVQHRQVPQAQEIHFQQAQLLQRDHVVLADDGLVIPGQRHIFIHRQAGDHHTGGMGGGVAGHALQRLGHVDEPLHPLVGLVEVGQLLAEPQGIVQRDMQRTGTRGHQLGHTVHLGIGHVQGAAHIPDGAPGSHGSEGHDLGHVVVPVLPADVVHHLAPAGIAEVHVDIRHGHALRIQETLEIQLVLHGVDVGDVQAVGHHGAGGAAAAGTHGYARLPGIVDEVGHDEEIVGKAHLLDHGQLIFQLLAVLRLFVAVAADKALVAQLAKIGG